MPSTARPKILAAVVLCLATVVFFTTFDGYRTSGESVLPNLNFSEGLSHWGHTETGLEVIADHPPTLRLTNADPKQSVYLVQTLTEPGRFEHLKLSLEVKVEDVRKGAHPSNRARVVFASYDAAGTHLGYYPHVLFALWGNKQWRHYEKVFAVSGEVSEMRLTLQLSGTTGTMWVRNLHLEPATERTAYSALRALLILLWGALLLWVSLPLAKAARRRPFYTVMLLTGALVLLGTLSPKKYESYFGLQILSVFTDQVESQKLSPASIGTSATTTQTASTQTNAKPPSDLPPEFYRIRDLGKVAHVALFALLGFALVRARDDESALFLLGCLGLSAVSSEVLQLFTQGRQAQVLDSGLNAAGASFGLGMAYLWGSLRRRLKSRLFRTSD